MALLHNEWCHKITSSPVPKIFLRSISFKWHHKNEMIESIYVSRNNVNLILRIDWKLSTILETSNKNVWSNIFWYIKVCIFWKCIQYTIIEIKQTLKKLFSDKINGTKNTLFFLSHAPTYHSFNFKFWFLNELKHKARLSKTVCGIFGFVFIKVYIFFNKMHKIFGFKTS